jgi:isopenicillin-N epimerase
VIGRGGSFASSTSESARFENYVLKQNSSPLPSSPLRPDRDADWESIAAEWTIRPGTTYLNHGSFGIPPRAVREARRQWLDVADSQPMDMFVRKFACEIVQVRQRLAKLVGTNAGNLVLVENATFGMNVVAESWPLKPGDQIVLNAHEYGAVRRIWERRCRRTGAEIADVNLPPVFESPEQVVDAIFSQIGPRASLLVISHITSPTALILPIEAICWTARQRGIPVCVDGPHAPAHVPLNIESLDCDFYVASCHKWLAATLGTGFLYAHPRVQHRVEPLIKSWGLLLPDIPRRWDEEFTWSGTRDPSIYLSIPAAIDFLEAIGWDSFRGRAYHLADRARELLAGQLGTEPLGRGPHRWYGTMAHVPLPPGDWSELQARLWREFSIEVPIICFENAWYVRVSCHLYTTAQQLDYLADSLAQCGAGR